MRFAPLALAVVLAVPATATAQVAPVKPRISVLVDTSGSMLNTPQIITMPESTDPTMRNASCSSLGFNGCTANGTNPSPAQETCNACVADTIHFVASCATNWSATCRADYSACVQAVTGLTCGTGNGTNNNSPNLNIADGILTRGDGTLETPGCDLNGNGLPDDSRLFQAKGAVTTVVSTFGEVEFALWRYKGEDGGGACATAANCPKTPGGLTVFSCDSIGGQNKCDLNAVNFDQSATTAGQCFLNGWNGAASGFSCSQCNFTTSYERAECDAWHLDQDRTGAVTLFPGSSATVNCALPSTNHPNYKYEGAVRNGAVCDPDAGERLVDFPATGFDDNYTQLIQWMDNDGTETAFGLEPELKAQGLTPIAGSLKSMLPVLQATIAADSKAACRPYEAIIVTDGGETCESVANAKTAAAALFNNNPHIPVYVIGFAICPGGTTTCQTAMDLNGIAASGGTTQAFFANDQLSLQAALATIVQGSVKTELCNGIDDDCDNVADEDFPGEGNPCTVGVGSCQRTGTLICTSTTTLGCSATAGTPGTESCNNGVDEDCDGLVDEGCTQSCIPSCLPSQGCDGCNGKDDDCDGKVDENFVSSSCGLNIGQCKPGTTTCTNGVVACSGGTGPVAETCNGKDDDCDGITDGESQACYPVGLVGCNPDGSNCKGICRSGTQTCSAGAFSTCASFTGPVTEIACNNLDDDCDGLVDEGKGPEICDGIDNDCDGNIDEDVATSDPKIGTTCGGQPSVGACHNGTFQCIAGGYSCVGAQGPVAETCNNIDDNCNGTTDEGVASPGACGSSVGTCTPGTLQCQAGSFVCVGATGPGAEVCDGKDNNCNGLTDETDPNLGNTCTTTPSGQPIPNEVGACHFGVLACSAGALTCVGGVGPTTETCNRIDDDCDGVVDNGFPLLGQACDNGQQGICKQNGIYVCAANGQGVVCTAPAGSPGTETCNGLDDDCDGTTDELPMPTVGTVCAPATGNCQPGLWECQNGALVCGAASSGSNEVCNGKDDDCDNIIDEGPLATDGQNCYPTGTIGCDVTAGTCTGECKFGKTQCTNGNPDACNSPPPITPINEICDGKDNDCDGTVDEAAACPNGDVCNSGECVVPCMTGEFPCSAGYDCEDLPQGMFCVPDPCKGVTCPGQEVCKKGTCIDLCDGITCPSNEVCQQGFCLDCVHLPSLCTPGQLCIVGTDGTGTCTDNPCDPNPCQPGQICTNGACSDSCANCPDGTICQNGSCVTDMCAMVRCPSGQVCDPSDGSCKVPKCEGIQCQPGQVCVDTTGACETDPCLTTTCTTGQVCSVDPDGNAVCGLPPEPKHDRVTAAGGGCSAGGDGAAPWLLGVMLIPIVRRRRGGAQ